ncbi:UDP-galactopyranose mutase [Listeria aquatica]|uniref:UDP-galactopyranose mutase n=1 Tax=Listeria aquatica TaxID=1494960 RepID=UPI003F727ACB
MPEADYLIIGAGLFGAVFAREAAEAGKSVLVLEKRPHIAGNIYTKQVAGIEVHQYGAHIFHTKNQAVWRYVHQFADFLPFINSPLANYKGTLYPLPFNMHTFHALWGVTSPAEARAIIQKETAPYQLKKPTNLEEQALSMVGPEIYHKLIEGYTQKQWGKEPRELPSFIIKRIPLRWTFDNNYFNDPFQGIPQKGYTDMVEKMLSHPNITVQTNTDFLSRKETYLKQFSKIIYTGMIDEFFDYRFGALEYRSLRFETEVLQQADLQENAVINYTDQETPFTRIIEHKHFTKQESDQTVVTKEYPEAWNQTKEPFYPINDKKNQRLYKKYVKKAHEYPQVHFGGRLGSYQYLDMDQVIYQALVFAKHELHMPQEKSLEVADKR